MDHEEVQFRNIINMKKGWELLNIVKSRKVLECFDYKITRPKYNIRES